MTAVKVIVVLALGLLLIGIISHPSDPNERFCLKAGPSATYFITDENDNDFPMSCEDLLEQDGDLTDNNDQ
jgi:hypothetical protein